MTTFKICAFLVLLPIGSSVRTDFVVQEDAWSSMAMKGSLNTNVVIGAGSLKAVANVNDTHTEPQLDGGAQPFQWATEVTSWLFDHREEIGQPDVEGRLPLLWRTEGDEPTTRAIVEMIADPSIPIFFRAATRLSELPDTLGRAMTLTQVTTRMLKKYPCLQVTVNRGECEEGLITDKIYRDLDTYLNYGQDLQRRRLGLQVYWSQLSKGTQDDQKRHATLKVLAQHWNTVHEYTAWTPDNGPAGWFAMCKGFASNLVSRALSNEIMMGAAKLQFQGKTQKEAEDTAGFTKLISMIAAVVENVDVM